ncbi:PREDICTED: uncharacterized protein LOC108975094 [Bactrocera latifrons]|uniref:HMG box domain-containing protein n=1 Tax=Bactrocera latifrons TaxID=174628 RepID=A0A0K8W5X0_BACLA|nr:PREDICTED: uncharacterized protein LOC108968497 [Bactrocera latifrons]XP_018798907.1 PREDICTED: uncharacterized protein LOC108975094 [Bactrocera latifrons]
MVKTCCVNTPKQTATSATAAKASYSRNAFMHFLSEYRRVCNRRSPAWLTATEAGEVWSRMPLNDKYCYIEAARNAGYVYTARDRRMNRVMRHLRKSLTDNEHRVNLMELSLAVKQMQLWKRRTLDEMCRC